MMNPASLAELSVQEKVIVSHRPSLAKQADEKGPALIDSAQTHLDHISVLCGISLGHTPSQVNIDHVELSFLTPFAQLGEYTFYQVVPLGVHVIEGATDKDIDLFPFDRFTLILHGLLPHK